MLPTVAGSNFKYIANSPVAHHELCRALDMQSDPRNVNLSIWKDDRLRGGIIYERFTRKAIFLHIAGFEPRWFNRTFLWLGFHYPFEQLGVEKIFGLVSSNRTASLAFFRRLGFVVETSIKDVYADGADQVVLVMGKADCKWLKLRENPNGHI